MKNTISEWFANDDFTAPERYRKLMTRLSFCSLDKARELVDAELAAFCEEQIEHRHKIRVWSGICIQLIIFLVIALLSLWAK